MSSSDSGRRKEINSLTSQFAGTNNGFVVFVLSSDNLTPRIVWTMLVEIIVLIITIVLAMVETDTWPTPFFYLTLVCVVVLNMANGVYQNTVYGLAARLPAKYTGAVVLGSVTLTIIDKVGQRLSHYIDRPCQ